MGRAGQQELIEEYPRFLDGFEISWRGWIRGYQLVVGHLRVGRNGSDSLRSETMGGAVLNGSLRRWAAR